MVHAMTLDLPSGLTAEDLLDIYATMVLIRTLDERIWAMNRQGKAAIVASSQGHEAAQLTANGCGVLAERGGMLRTNHIRKTRVGKTWLPPIL